MQYTPKRPPWAHQKEALARMAGKPAFALLMAMRTGKTKTVLDDWCGMADTVPDLCIIAPAGVYRTWLTAIADHVGAPLDRTLLTYLWSAKTSTTVSGKAEEEAFMAERRRPRCLLVNVEALSGVERARVLVQNFLSARRSMMCIDESTTIKNPKARRTKFINKQLGPRAAYRRILSGLPTPKSPLDLYCQFEFLNPRILGHSSYWGFRNTYAIMKQIRSPTGRMVDIPVAYRNVDQLQALIAPHSYRRTLEECYDLPPKIYQRREVALTDEQRKAYNELKLFATTQLGSGEHVTVTQVITQMLRMHQVLCGHTASEDGMRHELPELRTKALLELLEEHSGKGILWCSYDADVRKVAAAVAAEYGPESVARFWGGNRDTREDEEARFLRDPACRYMVATAAAGGRGRTWTVADLVVYYSNTYDLEHRAQSEERAQGIDKINSVLYIDLVAPGTVDEVILKALRGKINMAAAITGANWKDWVV